MRVGIADLDVYRRPDRSYDELGLQIPRNPFVGEAGTRLFLSIGGAREFRHVVPDEHVVRVLVVGEAVACRCGVLAPLVAGGIVGCPGRCGRHFLRAESTVRVARWPLVDEEEAEEA